MTLDVLGYTVTLRTTLDDWSVFGRKLWKCVLFLYCTGVSKTRGCLIIQYLEPKEMSPVGFIDPSAIFTMDFGYL